MTNANEYRPRRQVSGMLLDVTYHSECQDGYRAQGWKLNLAMDDPAVIACTAYTGNKTPTSVLVHDILDHLISGFWLSGYINEARATAMHGLRNGIKIRSSYEWMVNEILSTNNLKEPISGLLPANISTSIPALTAPDKTLELLLKNNHPADIRRHLMEGFFRTGLSGIPIAVSNWRTQCLDFGKMYSIGLCLQALLAEAQDIVVDWASETAKGQFFVGNEVCKFAVETDEPSRQECIIKYVAWY